MTAPTVVRDLQTELARGVFRRRPTRAVTGSRGSNLSDAHSQISGRCKRYPNHFNEEAGQALLRDGLMTIPETAVFLRLSRSTIYGLMERGELPYVCIGSSRRIPRRALVDLAASHLRGDLSVSAAKIDPAQDAWR